MIEHEKDKIRTLRQKGASYAAIAQHLGYSVNTIKSFCRKEQHVVHENYMEPIISREDFDAAQAILATRTKNKQRNGQNHHAYRYSGRLKCAECGNGFTVRTRQDKECCALPETVDIVRRQKPNETG